MKAERPAGELEILFLNVFWHHMNQVFLLQGGRFTTMPWRWLVIFCSNNAVGAN